MKLKFRLNEDKSLIHPRFLVDIDRLALLIPDFSPMIQTNMDTRTTCNLRFPLTQRCANTFCVRALRGDVLHGEHISQHIVRSH